MRSKSRTNRNRALTSFVLIFTLVAVLVGIQPEGIAEAQTTVTFTAQELLARPTNTSITINVIPDSAIELFYEYKKPSDASYSSTPITSAAAGQPNNVVLSGLDPNTKYSYHMQYRKQGDSTWVTRGEHSFHTQRTTGETFTFVVTSDFHSSMNQPYFNTANLNKTLSHMLADSPDLWIDLGDTPCLDFLTTAQAYRQGYLTLRNQIASISGDVPIFKALGNHEQEMGWNLDDKADTSQTQPVWAHNARRAIFPAPKPDGFYSGNTDTSLTYLDEDHLREDYFAWTWGDAQFIVLDPYWYTMKWPQEDSTYPFGGEEGTATEPRGTRWDWTLGIQQYLWLKNVLETSTSAYKFVFIHNVTGGIIPYGRGGTEISSYFEWGGKNWDGSWGWDEKRPASEGWDLPIHQMLDEYNVTIFFHGHDHFYAQQELDDVVYQEVPMPGATDQYVGFSDEQSVKYKDQYPDPTVVRFYDGAEKQMNSGHIRVTVSPANVKVEYIDMADGSITTSYTIPSGDPPEPVLGDVNNDSQANSTDALIVLSGDAGLKIGAFCPINCGDVNKDGLINSTDSLIILSFDAGLSVPAGLEQPGCPLSITQPAGCSP